MTLTSRHTYEVGTLTGLSPIKLQNLSFRQLVTYRTANNVNQALYCPICVGLGPITAPWDWEVNTWQCSVVALYSAAHTDHTYRPLAPNVLWAIIISTDTCETPVCVRWGAAGGGLENSRTQIWFAYTAHHEDTTSSAAWALVMNARKSNVKGLAGNKVVLCLFQGMPRENNAVAGWE